MMPYMFDTIICFDLDDTLYKELDYVKSAYGEIAETIGHPEVISQMIDWFYEGKNVFAELISTYKLELTIADCIRLYRNHFPKISLESNAKDFFLELKEEGALIGMITDGRSISQRNKIKALGLEGFFDIVIISEEFGSEKPNRENYSIVQERFPERKRFIYVGDNTKKDFVTPNQLNWVTVCLKNDGRNIHKQEMSLPKEYMPRYMVNSFKDIIDIVKLRH